MTEDLKFLISDIGIDNISDFLNKSSFGDLLITENPDIQYKLDEITLSIQYLLNKYDLSIPSYNSLSDYKSFIKKYFLKFCEILIQDFGARIKKSISEFYKTNKQLDFNVLDWYYSFDGNDSTFYDFIEEPVQSNDVSYRVMQGEEIHINSDDTFYVKHQIKDYLRFWHKYYIYIDNYKDILITIKKQYSISSKNETEVNPSNKSINIDEVTLPKSETNKLSYRKRDFNKNRNEILSKAKILEELNNINGFKNLTEYGKEKVIGHYKELYVKYNDPELTKNESIFQTLHQHSIIDLHNIYSHIIFYNLLKSVWDKLSINLIDPSKNTDNTKNDILRLIEEIKSKMKPVLRGELFSAEYDVYGADAKSLKLFLNSIGFKNINDVPVFDDNYLHWGYYKKVVSNFLPFIVELFNELKEIPKISKSQSDYDNLVLLMKDTEISYEYYKYFDFKTPEPVKDSINIFLFYYKCEYDFNFKRKFDRIIKNLLRNDINKKKLGMEKTKKNKDETITRQANDITELKNKFEKSTGKPVEYQPMRKSVIMTFEYLKGLLEYKNKKIEYLSSTQIMKNYSKSNGGSRETIQRWFEQNKRRISKLNNSEKTLTPTQALKELKIKDLDKLFKEIPTEFKKS